jgi:hypothetical protein
MPVGFVLKKTKKPTAFPRGIGRIEYEHHVGSGSKRVSLSNCVHEKHYRWVDKAYLA